MRKLQIQNMTYNRNQLKRRKDGANQSCVINEFFKEAKKKEKKAAPKYEPVVKPVVQSIPF